MYIVIVDNGCIMQLGCFDFCNFLKCICCGACMNICFIYWCSGGYSYDFIVFGLIGFIFMFGIDLKKYSGLLFVFMFCGFCFDVCLVKIDIYEQLYKWW